MSDLSVQAAALLADARRAAGKKKILGFGGPDYDDAVESAERAANMYKMDKDYERAANALTAAADWRLLQGRKQQAAGFLQNAVGCMNLAAPERSAELLERLVRISAEAGQFMQAGKACVREAEQLVERRAWPDAAKAYARAEELFRTESHADSDLREARQRRAEITAQHLQEYAEAAAIFEDLGTQCTKIRLLAFHARGHFLNAFLCLGAFGDAVALSDASGRFRALDLNLEGSPEGDFMAEAAEAFAAADHEAFEQAAGRFEARSSLRGNLLARELIWRTAQHIAPDAEEKEEGDGVL